LTLSAKAVERMQVRPTPFFQDSGHTSTTCTWEALDGRFDLTLVKNHAVGLELVDQLGEVLMARDPISVNGYPAVRIDAPDAPTCRVVVGVAASQAFSAGASMLTTDAPPLCDLALALAEETIAALRTP
jgi:hypothetical protein